MENLIERLAEAAQSARARVAVAESLTCGMLASTIGRGESAQDWFAGGVVAYQTRTKNDVLGVAEGIDVVSGECAEQLAGGVRSLLGADIAVSTTGVGGPDAEGEHEPGTVYLGWADAGGTAHRLCRFEGGPEEVLEQTVEAAMALLAELVEGAASDSRAQADGAPEQEVDAGVSGVRIRPVEEDDAGEVLTLQRAAFVQEALIYDSVQMPPLTQTLEQVRAELEANLGCVAVTGGRIVGAARARRDGDLLLIGRISIAPDQQGAGLGSALLDAVEARGRSAGCREAELFTGSLSEANLRLYERCGYRERERVDGDDGVQQVFLRKTLAAPS